MATLFTIIEYNAAANANIQLIPAMALIPSQESKTEQNNSEMTILFLSFPPMASSINDEKTSKMRIKDNNVYIDLFHFSTPRKYSGEIRSIAINVDRNLGSKLNEESKQSQPSCLYFKNDITPDVRRNIKDNILKVSGMCQ